MELESRIEPTARFPQATGFSSYWKTCCTVVLEVSSLCAVSAVVRKHKLCGVVNGGVAATPLTVGCSLQNPKLKKNSPYVESSICLGIVGFWR